MSAPSNPPEALRVVRFGLVALLNSVLGYSVIVIILRSGAGDIAANLAGYAVGLTAVCGRPFGCKRFLSHGWACGQVRSCVRPQRCGRRLPRARMEICRSGPFRLPALEGASAVCWFSRSGLVTVCPCASLALLTSPTSPDDHSPMQLRPPDPGSPRPCASAPKRRAPCGWPARRRPASAVSSPASAPATSPRARLCAPPIALRRPPR